MQRDGLVMNDMMLARVPSLGPDMTLFSYYPEAGSRGFFRVGNAPPSKKASILPGLEQISLSNRKMSNTGTSSSTWTSQGRNLQELTHTRS